jgi:hypothetical protein
MGAPAMSGKATGWARDQWCSGGLTAKAVLLLMGDYATGPRHELWPSVETMARELQTTDRTIFRTLNSLEADGLIWRSARTLGSGKRTSTLYRLMVDGRVSPDTVSPLSPDTESPLSPDTESPLALTESQGDPDTESGLILSKESDPKNGCGARATFDEVLAAWMGHAKRSSRTNPEASWEAWAGACDLIDEAELAARARRALAEDLDFKRRGPPALQKWLAEGKWANWADASEGGGTPSPAASFPDAEIRARVVARRGEAYARTWLDGAALDGLTIRPRTNTAGDHLRRDLRPLLAELGLTVTDKGA